MIFGEIENALFRSLEITCRNFDGCMQYAEELQDVTDAARKVREVLSLLDKLRNNTMTAKESQEISDPKSDPNTDLIEKFVLGYPI